MSLWALCCEEGHYGGGRSTRPQVCCELSIRCQHGIPLTSWYVTHCALSCRPVCGVAGIPSSQSSTQHHLQHSASTSASLPHCSHTGGAGSALAYRAQVDNSPTILMPSSLQAPQPQEQNGILDWLRKLRLHKYYPISSMLWCLKALLDPLRNV